MQYDFIDIFSTIFLILLLFYIRKNKPSNTLYVIIFILISFFIIRHFNISDKRCENFSTKFYNTASLDIYYPEKKYTGPYPAISGHYHKSNLNDFDIQHNKKYRNIYNGTWTSDIKDDKRYYQIIQMNNLLYLSVIDKQLEENPKETMNIQFELNLDRDKFIVTKINDLSNDSNFLDIKEGQLLPVLKKIMLKTSSNNIFLKKVSDLSTDGYTSRSNFNNPLSNYSNPQSISAKYETCEDNGYTTVTGPNNIKLCSKKKQKYFKNDKSLCSTNPLFKSNGVIPTCSFYGNSTLLKNTSSTNSILQSTNISNNDTCSNFYHTDLDNKYFIIINAHTHETLSSEYYGLGEDESNIVLNNTFITKSLNSDISCSMLSSVNNLLNGKYSADIKKYIQCISKNNNMGALKTCTTNVNLSPEDRSYINSKVLEFNKENHNFDYDDNQLFDGITNKLDNKTYLDYVGIWKITPTNKGQGSCDVNIMNIPTRSNKTESKTSTRIEGRDNGKLINSLTHGNSNQIFRLTNISIYNDTECYKKLQNIGQVIKCNIVCNNQLHITPSIIEKNRSNNNILILKSEPVSVNGDWILVSISAKHANHAAQQLNTLKM